MNAVYKDQMYNQIAKDLVSRLFSYGDNSNVIGVIGFYLALRKQNKLSNNDLFGSAYDQILEIDSSLKIDIREICRNKPNERLIQEVIHVICMYSDLDYARLFETIIHLYSTQEGKLQGEFIQPIEVTHFVTSLLKDENVKSVYNPFAGLMSYQLDNPSVHYCAQELNRRIWLIGKIRLFLHGVKSDFVCEDSITHWKGNYKEFDAIIGTPPFGMHIHQHYYPMYAGSRSYIHKRIDSYFLEQALNSITDNGMVICITSPNFLMNAIYQQFRKFLVAEGHVEKVILLPGNLFYETSISGVVLKLTRKRNKGVVMVDGSTLFEKQGRLNILQYEELLHAVDWADPRYTRFVLKEEIESNDFNLSPQFYLSSASEVVEVPEGYKLCKLKELGTVYKNSNVHLRFSRFVRGKDLADGRFAFDKTFEDLEQEEISQRGIVLDKDLLLLLKVGNLKPTYFHKTTDFPVCCNSNIVAFEINERIIYPQYLVNELGKEYVSRQVKARYGGAVIPSINLNNLLEIEVLVPDFKSQIAVFENDKQNYSLLKARELGLENVISQLKADYLSVVEDRQHDMRKHLRNLRHSNKLIRGFFTKIKDGSGSEIEEVLSVQENAINILSNMIAEFASEDQFGNPEKINIDGFFKSLVSNHTSEINYKIIYDLDSTALCEYGLMASSDLSISDLNVYIASLDLTRLVNNILGNAEMHSFTDKERTDYELRIELSIDKEKDMFRIDFRNNGIPFPQGLTKELYGRRGKSAGKTKNKGTGGYVVQSICKHVGGDFEIYSNLESNFPVTVRLYLPIHKDDEQI